MLAKQLVLLSLIIIALGACSQDHAGGSISETQNAEITLIDSKPALMRANSTDTLRRWQFEISNSDSVWTLQLQGSLQNAKLIDSWKAHLGSKFLTFEEKTLSPLNVFNGEIVKSEIVENTDSSYVEIDFKLKNDITTYLIKSKILAVKEFELLSSGRGTIWHSVKSSADPNLYYTSCNGGLKESFEGECSLDTNLCELSKTIMCVDSYSLDRPQYPIHLDSTIGAQVAEWSQGWSGRSFNRGTKVKGSLITSKAVGDSICQNNFGTASEWASDTLSKYIEGMSETEYIGEAFSSASKLQTGGWGFYGYWTNSAPTENTGLWVHSSRPQGNCWFE